MGGLGGASSLGGGSYSSEARTSSAVNVGGATFGDKVLGKGASKGLDWKTLLIIGAAVIAAMFLFKRRG